LASLNLAKEILTTIQIPDFDGRMKTKFIQTLCVALLASGILFAGDKKGGAEQAVRDTDEQWSKAAAAKDFDKTVSFYADDAMVLPPNEPAVTSKDGIRNLWKGFLDSLTDISWKATRVEMAKSGDMACLIGTYQMTMKDGTKDRGKYCEVWEKQSDGKWKVGTDMFSSDLPATPATTSPAPGAAEKK
jgi:uncharacterized protein (TIGR02246 family)